MSPIVVESASLDTAQVYVRLGTRPGGLTAAEATTRLVQYGPNVLAQDHRAGFGKRLWRSVLNPLVLLLAVLAGVSFATGDLRAALLMVSMIVLSVGLKLIQETKADNAAAKLKAMISVTATALRDGAAQEIPVAQLVPGDVVQLAAGDMVPGDVRIVQAKDLFVIQGSLTGEASRLRNSRSRRALPRRCAARAHQHRVPRHQRRKRLGHACSLRRVTTPISAAWPDLWRTAAADGFRPRHIPVHLADAPLHTRDGAVGFPH